MSAPSDDQKIVRVPFPSVGGDADERPLESDEATWVLISRAREGDANALNDLCARYLPRLTRWAHGRLPAGSAIDTHDIVQETLAHVVRRLPGFEPRHEGAFQAYVRRALLNRIRDEARKLKRKGPDQPLKGGHAAADPSPLEEAIGQEAVEAYEAAMNRLRDEDRQAIIGRLELGLPYEELAPMLGKPTVSAAHVAVSRALIRLAKEMSRSSTEIGAAPSSTQAKSISTPPSEFTVSFDESLSSAQVGGLLTALADYFRSCGGEGLELVRDSDHSRVPSQPDARA